MRHPLGLGFSGLGFEGLGFRVLSAVYCGFQNLGALIVRRGFGFFCHRTLNPKPKTLNPYKP